MKKIYIAGPDVFEEESVEIGKGYVQLCKKYGYRGQYPLDNVVDFNQNKQKIALDIFVANKNMIDESDIVIANLNMFRGKEADSGTVWECGYAFAKGKKVYAYALDRRPMIERVHEQQELSDDATLCQDGKIIEDFGLSHNLMMLDIIVAQSAKECLKFIAKS